MVSQSHRKKVMHCIIFSETIHSLIPDLLERKRSVQRFTYSFLQSHSSMYIGMRLCKVPPADLPRYLSQKHY